MSGITYRIVWGYIKYVSFFLKNIENKFRDRYLSELIFKENNLAYDVFILSCYF